MTARSPFTRLNAARVFRDRRAEARRDCEPHRGSFLQLLGAASMLLGILSICFLLPSLAGVPLGLWVWRMARLDQEQMHSGLMDPDGKEAVEVAHRWAVDGLRLCVISWCIWGFVLYHVWLGL
jgi:hypothetical protein